MDAHHATGGPGGIQGKQTDPSGGLDVEVAGLGLGQPVTIV